MSVSTRAACERERRRTGLLCPLLPPTTLPSPPLLSGRLPPCVCFHLCAPESRWPSRSNGESLHLNNADRDGPSSSSQSRGRPRGCCPKSHALPSLDRWELDFAKISARRTKQNSLPARPLDSGKTRASGGRPAVTFLQKDTAGYGGIPRWELHEFLAVPSPAKLERHRRCGPMKSFVFP